MLTTPFIRGTQGTYPEEEALPANVRCEKLSDISSGRLVMKHMSLDKLVDCLKTLIDYKQRMDPVYAF